MELDRSNVTLQSTALHFSSTLIYPHWSRTYFDDFISVYQSNMLDSVLQLLFTSSSVVLFSFSQINFDGGLSMDILTPAAWNPSIRISQLLMTIYSLLTEPNADDPVMPEIAHLFKNDRARHDQVILFVFD